MPHPQGNVREFFLNIVTEQDKYDALKNTDRCDRCIQPAAARLFFEPNEQTDLPSLLLCPSHLLEHREKLAMENITGGFIDKSSLWWWERIMGEKAGVVSKY